MEYKPKHAKPGRKSKTAKIKNRYFRLHDIYKPDELICSNCNTLDLSCVPCHPEDTEIKYLFGGRGTGEKVNDVGNTLESWSLSMTEALDFGDTVLAMEVSTAIGTLLPISNESGGV